MMARKAGRRRRWVRKTIARTASGTRREARSMTGDLSVQKKVVTPSDQLSSRVARIRSALKRGILPAGLKVPRCARDDRYSDANAPPARPPVDPRPRRAGGGRIAGPHRG